MDLTAISFRASRRRRSSPSHLSRLTSTASRRISVHFLSQHLTQPLSHQRLKLPLQHCGLPVCSRQDGKWIREEKMSASLRDTSEPGAWCFVLSSFCNASVEIDVIVYNFLMYFCSFAASEHSGGTAMVSRYHQRECESQLSWQPAVA